MKGQVTDDLTCGRVIGKEKAVEKNDSLRIRVNLPRGLAVSARAQAAVTNLGSIERQL